MKTSKEQKKVAVTEQQADNALDYFKERFDWLCAELHKRIPKEEVGIAMAVVVTHAPGEGGIDCTGTVKLMGIPKMINRAVNKIALHDFNRRQ